MRDCNFRENIEGTDRYSCGQNEDYSVRLWKVLYDNIFQGKILIDLAHITIDSGEGSDASEKLTLARDHFQKIREEHVGNDFCNAYAMMNNGVRQIPNIQKYRDADDKIRTWRTLMADDAANDTERYLANNDARLATANLSEYLLEIAYKINTHIKSKKCMMPWVETEFGG